MHQLTAGVLDLALSDFHDILDEPSAPSSSKCKERAGTATARAMSKLAEKLAVAAEKMQRTAWRPLCHIDKLPPEMMTHSRADRWRLRLGNKVS